MSVCMYVCMYVCTMLALGATPLYAYAYAWPLIFICILLLLLLLLFFCFFLERLSKVYGKGTIPNPIIIDSRSVDRLRPQHMGAFFFFFLGGGGLVWFGFVASDTTPPSRRRIWILAVVSMLEYRIYYH